MAALWFRGLLPEYRPTHGDLQRLGLFDVSVSI